MALSENDVVLCSDTSKSESLISSNTDLFVKGSINFNGPYQMETDIRVESFHTITPRPFQLVLWNFFFFFFNQVKTFFGGHFDQSYFFMQDQITFRCDTTTIILHRMKVKRQSEN